MEHHKYQRKKISINQNNGILQGGLIESWKKILLCEKNISIVVSFKFIRKINFNLWNWKKKISVTVLSIQIEIHCSGCFNYEMVKAWSAFVYWDVRGVWQSSFFFWWNQIAYAHVMRFSIEQKDEIYKTNLISMKLSKALSMKIFFLKGKVLSLKIN